MTSESAYIEACVTVARDQVGAVESLMESQGALAVTLVDVEDDPILEPGVGERPLWPTVGVTGLFDRGVPEQRLRDVLSLAPGVERPDRVRIGALSERDWVAAWKDDFGPMRFGQRLWVVPHGVDAPDPDGSLIRLDPGLAFGTGTHPSTRLCLEWLDGANLEGLSVLDFGCGSGILGIAAARLGAREVRGIDHDPQAVTAARENAARNGVAHRLHVTAGEEPAGDPADVVIANILAGVLIELAPALRDAVRPGGRLVLAGILAQQAPDVAAVYRGAFPQLETRHDSGWALLAGRKAA